MEILSVKFQKTSQNRDYDILIGENALEILFADLQTVAKGKTAVFFMDENLEKIYGKYLVEKLQSQEIQFAKIVLPAGEKSKSIEQTNKTLEKLSEMQISKDSIFVAFGGGVVGDLVGFIAGIYLRGVPFIQVPTSFLAMNDSSVGGKTGVNLSNGKNLVGLFNQPLKVYIDLNLLKTLPEDQFKAGYSETIKHAIISDNLLFEILERADQKALFNDFKLIELILTRSIAVKAEIVIKDEKETHERMKLNLGHTIAHALEKVTNFQIPHGQAVSIGISVICDFAVEEKFLATQTSERIKKLLEKLNLPIQLDKNLINENFFNALKVDKKIRDNSLNLIIPKDIAKVSIQTHPNFIEFLSTYGKN
jgi:3-dehydroquinate synthase